MLVLLKKGLILLYHSKKKAKQLSFEDLNKATEKAAELTVYDNFIERPYQKRNSVAQYSL